MLSRTIFPRVAGAAGQAALRSLPRIQSASRAPLTRSFFKIVTQGEEAYRLSLGRNPTHLAPGIRLWIPLYHEIRNVDMREGTIRIKELHAYTKDNVPVTITGTLFYRVVNSYKACFNVQDYLDSTTQLGTSAARSVMGQFDYDDINSDRNSINQSLAKTIHESADNWGLSCTRFEIQDFRPQNDHVKKQLELQVAAERSRRENDLNTKAAVRTAEGEKEASILRSEGELTSARNTTDAVKYRLDAETAARTLLIRETVNALNGDHVAAARYLIEMARVEQLKAIANGHNNSTFFLPTELLASLQAVADKINVPTKPS